MPGSSASKRIVTALGLSICLAIPTAAQEVGVFGRVRVSSANDADAASVLFVERTLESRYTPSPGRTRPDVRLISVGPREGEPDRFDATIYDYGVECGFELILDRSGTEIARQPLTGQPALSEAELEDAMTVVARTSMWAAGVAAGSVEIYPPMPGVTTGEDGTRLVNVGLLRRGSEEVASDHEIVSVHVPTGRIVRYPVKAPPTSLATLTTCGPPSQDCGVGIGSCTLYHYEWPAAEPVWKFDMMHPSCTPAIQGDGTGLEIQNVRYRDRLVIARADVPVLNVQYEGDVCGPYRDWLFMEDCFQASGTMISPGILLASSPVTSICDTNSDAGNFRGIAIEDLGSELRLVTEQAAGWYRYVMEWRLHVDGTFEPIFGFGAVANSCICSHHDHHAYWRFEMALDGTPGIPSSGICTLERAAGAPGAWSPVFTEGSFVRPPADPAADRWRVRNPGTGFTCEIDPGPEDGTADGDAYAKADVWALALNAGQINDPEADTRINVDPWINGEAIGGSKRLVLWYRAGFDHDHDSSGDDCHRAGPTFRFTRTCPATLVVARALYGCSEAASISVDDDDHIGAGTLDVAVRSTAEPVPETATLTETPALSGHFEGTFPLTGAAPVQGDGMISTTDGDTLTVAYLDEASCGAVNVELEQTASVDCAAPAITDVVVSSVTTSSATISWTTGETGTSRVTYGTSAPPGTVAESPTPVVAHEITVSGLTSCTTYYFSVSSTDATGNVGVDANGGAYYSFTTPAPVAVPCPPSLAEETETVVDRCGSSPPDGVDPGDALVISVTASNAGYLPATNVTATLSTITPGITILDGTASFPDLPGQGNGGSIAPHFALAIDPDVPCVTSIELSILLTADQGSWNDAFTVPVPAGCKRCEAGPPSEEVQGVLWHSDRSTLTWSPSTGAGWYRVVRGTDADFPALLTADPDSCLRAIASDVSTDPGLDEAPESSTLYWYLVIAVNTAGVGTAGDASAGPRILDPSGSCP